ncbi:aminotransferase class III-fold pyridoxal phosphate-dependent enzyme, partial [bacterium]|nr:aminotransferase class III-fold pyridoxal phosphate-dependent enzyme [bacterium]
CAIALKALEILESENLVTRAWELGSKFQDRLFGLNSKYVAQVRGKGLLIGIVLKESAGGARQFCERLMQLGVLCKETHEHVIRVAPPLIVNQQELDFAFEKIQEVLQS